MQRNSLGRSLPERIEFECLQNRLDPNLFYMEKSRMFIIQSYSFVGKLTVKNVVRHHLGAI
ncbi:hypothetical protein PAUR_b0671 [Pseudoalteromonas aurantia 208]|uniref:Uncharacterized protein n=1 Tax=Pseudoalteromonas aurantia 208 TaxID=1314867 RepID=A0ABR9EHZ2_9GAMM|nr:hypothetical protein [Pseudoalteromonas aurantia 208]